MLTTEIAPHKENIQWKCYVVLGFVCALVIGIFIWSAKMGFLELASGRFPRDGYYNLLVQGFRAGQLNVKREAPPGLAQLADPYDPAVNASYTSDPSHLCFDMSYYKGKLYLYFGVTPALVLFWPYVVLTGHYLAQKNAVVIFYVLGFLLAAGLLRAIWRRFFPEVSSGVVALLMLALGLATGIPEILSRCDVYEVAMSSGFTFTMLALAAVWCAMHEPKRQILWLLLASLAYGLAIGSRPSLMFGAIILLAPVAQAWRATTEPGSRRRAGILFMAAVGPLILIGVGLMLYNFLRFDDPFEFGWHYQLTGYQSNTVQQFSLHYFWLNFRFYFLQPMLWAGHFPFLQAVSFSPLPAGYFGVGEPYSGILSDCPLVWLALASPLAWRGRLGGEACGLRWFVTASLLLFVTCALTLCFFFSASSRYEVDFLPTLMLLAVIGILGLERALAHSPVWRLLARCGWCLLLGYSLVFNLLASVEAHAATDYILGNTLLNQGRVDDGINYFQKAVALDPESATFHVALGTGFCMENRVQDAIIQYQKALVLQPKFADAYNSLGNALRQKGDMAGAVAQYKKALEIKPDFAAAQNNLGEALFKLGRVNEAIVQFEKLVVLQPESAIAHNDLGCCFSQAGRIDEAIAQFEKALQLHPDYSNAYHNLAHAFCEKGMAAKAIDCYQKIIKFRPGSIPARVNLAWMLATWPEPSVRDGDKAVALAQEAEHLYRGKDPMILRTLAAAYAEEGRFPEAVATAKEALALAMSQSASGLTNSLQKEIELYQTNSPCRSTDM